MSSEAVVRVADRDGSSGVGLCGTQFASLLNPIATPTPPLTPQELFWLFVTHKACAYLQVRPTPRGSQACSPSQVPAS